MKSTRKLATILLLLPCFAAFSQTHYDCQTAQEVYCESTFIEVAFTGEIGQTDDLSSTCLSQEFATTWFHWKIAQAGTLTFVLTPNNGTDDLDFAIFKLNAAGDCGNKTLVRCMAAGENVGQPLPQPCLGPTGLSLTETDAEELPGCSNGNNGFLAALQCSPNEEYVMVVNNFTQSGGGYKLEFDGNEVFSCNPTATADVAAHNLLLSPNPVHDFLNLELPKPTVASSFHVVNGMGQRIHSGSIIVDKMRLETSSLAPGFYYLIVEQDGKAPIVQKFVKA